jgi:hypothetical protein
MSTPLPEYESVEALAQYLLDDERTSFNLGEAHMVAKATKVSNLTVVRELTEYGFTLIPPSTPRPVRGFTANNHNRWEGNPGAGGGGGDSLTGFAGREG